MKDDKYIRYLKKRFSETKTINDIKRGEIIEFEGETLHIGEFFALIRRQHRLYEQGENTRGCRSELTINRYKELDAMNFIWKPGEENQKNLQISDPCLNFVTAYYDEHKTYEGMPNKVVIDGTEYNIKTFLSHVRTNHKRYLSGENQHGSDSKTFLKRYAELDKRKFDWEPKLRRAKALEEDDKYIRFLETFYEEHKSLDGVPKKVIFENEELDIYAFLENRRKKHRKKETTPSYNPSKLELKRWEALDRMHYDWNFHEKRKQELLKNDPFIRYLKENYSKYGSLNQISPKEEVIFEGKVLKIGVFINDCRKKHYAYTTKAKKTASTSSPLALKRYEELEKLGIDWRPSETAFNATAHAISHNLKPRTFKKYLTKFNGNVEKATKIYQAQRRYDSQVQQRKPSSSPTLKTIMQEFDIDIYNLVALLTRTSLRTKTATSSPLMYNEKQNLRDFCISNGLNYTVIQKAIKLKNKGLCDEDLQSLINRTITEYNKRGQQKPSTWIYSKYGNEALVRHLLISMNLDPEAILKDMSKNCLTIEEAIENNSFKRNSSDETSYMKPLYHDLIAFYNEVNHSPEYTEDTAPEAIITYFKQIIDDYQLTEAEFNTIKNSFKQYTDSIEIYKLYNVGFEKDPEKRVEKIIAYQLDEDEIEEAFFMPLRFDQQVLLGRDSELYQRRVILKNLTVSWNTLTPEEQSKKTLRYSLTDEELKYITETRTEIDATKAKVFSKK